MERTYSEGLQDFNNGVRSVVDRTAGKWLAKFRWVHPNMVTLAGAALCVFAAVIWSLRHHNSSFFWWGLVLFVAGAFFDAIDGFVAKLTGKKTVFGAELDTATDRVVETSMIVALALSTHGDFNKIVAVTALGGSLMVSYMRTRAEKLGLNGKVGFADRGVRMTIAGLGVLFGHHLQNYGGYALALYALNGAAWPTALWRLLAIRSQLIAKGTP